MDPVSLGIAGVGLGLKIFGGLSASDDQAQIAKAQQRVAGLEGQVDLQRKQAMELSARRQSMEVYRNIQRARAQGLNSAVNQGAQFGSGLQGGQASTTAQGLFNLQGINQNLEIGRNIFGLNGQINNEKGTIASLQGQLAQDNAWSNIGGSIMGSAGTASNIFGSAGSLFKGMNLGSPLMGGGSPSGY